MNSQYIYNTGESEKDLRDKYNPEGSTLRKAQHRMVEMLAFLDDVCKQNDIVYYLAFGSLLGAVRHNGFIPWDDDLDVYIKDTDLKRLREIINSGSYPYIVQSHSNDKGFVRYYNVLRDTKSEYIKDEYQHNLRKYRGIQIDLFPYEFGVLENGKKLVAKTIGLNEKYFLGKHRLLSELVYNVTYYFLIPFFKLIGKLKGKSYVCLGYEGLLPGHHFLSKDVFPLKQIEFEGLSVPCPNQPENILKIDYGNDYMNLPDEEMRDHHKVLRIRFDT